MRKVVVMPGIYRAIARPNVRTVERLAALVGVMADRPLSVRRLNSWIKEDPNSALQKCVDWVGTQTGMASILGVAQRTVSTWLTADFPNKPAKVPGNAVEEAVAKAGGQPKMAEELGVTQQCISNWCRQGYVPTARAQEIEHCYGVPRASLLSPKVRNALGAGGEL